MTKAVLSIGSNLGNRQEYLQLALDHLAECSHTIVSACSSVFETEPVGGPQQQDFLNAVVIVDTRLNPHELLDFVQGIEHEAQRERIEHWGPRTLDVDVIDFAGTRCDDEELTLPHPRAWQRAFVLVPWLTIEPDANLAGHGPIAELIMQVDDKAVHERQDLNLDTSQPESRKI